MRSLIYAAAAFCVFALLFGAAFFVLGGFILWFAQRRLLFAAIVAVPSLLAAGFTALVAASPAGFPGPIGDLTR